MLPSFLDCARRTAVKQWPDLVAEYVEPIGKKRSVIGAVTGTAAHKAVQTLYRNKLDGTNLKPFDAADEAMAKEIGENEIIWDRTTPTVDVARKQVRRIFEAYLPRAGQITPVAVEAKFEVELTPDWMLSGTIDVITDSGLIEDLKTGTKVSTYSSQLGGYALLAEQHGHHVSGVTTCYVRRVGLNADQPGPLIHTYDAASCRRLAKVTIKRIIAEITVYEKSRNPDDITANPMSLVCREKYCDLWGTAFCRCHLPKIFTDEQE